MLRQTLQIEALHPQFRQTRQHLGLAAARVAVEQDHLVQRRGVVELLHHPAAIAAVPARQHVRPPADLAQDHGHGIGAHAAAPAIDQGLQRGRPVGHDGFQVPGDIARDIGAADAPRLEARLLHIDRAHLGPLGVGQHRQVHRAGDVVDRELAGAARVDDHIESGERRRLGVCSHAHFSHVQIGLVPCGCYISAPPDPEPKAPSWTT